jgi:hypothetical protein
MDSHDYSPRTRVARSQHPATRRSGMYVSIGLGTLIVIILLIILLA